MTPVEGVLFDIDGVLVASWQPLAGPPRPSTPSATAGSHAPSSPTPPPAALRDCGMAVDAEEIVTAAALNAEYLREVHPGQRCLLINHGDIAGDMTGIEFDTDSPEVVVLGGPGPSSTTPR
ncbi:Haloacid dehalogenase (fragment) [Rhodococcus sp. RD6.2]